MKTPGMATFIVDARRFASDMATRQCGFADYKFIMDRFRDGDVSADEGFQRRFTYFYRVRRSREWLADFYRLFQEMRHDGEVSFGRILSRIADFSGGRVEISFASKMLATIDEDKPIWDKFVRVNLGLDDVPASGSSQERMAAADALYSKLCDITSAMLARDDVKGELATFDELFPDYAWMSASKKLDYLLWGANRLPEAE